MPRRTITTVLAVGFLVGATACTASSSSTTEAPSSSSVPASSSSATTAPSSTTAPGPQKSAEPDLSDREQRLDVQSGGEAHLLVTVPGGYEAATYDQDGNIRFWRNNGVGADWTSIGTSKYPSSGALGPPRATTSGALLQGMRNATFIVRGVFTGDSSGNAVAFTTGSKGWGAITAESNGNIEPSGRPVGDDLIGLSYDLGFVDGHLQTKDCPKDRAIAECGRHPVVKLWDWTGHDFEVR